ncbi:hypothetical protein CYMTET_6378 [Cymbomonas tetramitiformis]|uniref:Uncharacterized protein n=1 Tax=Cymbomonas tetramitiformis TaxID=36881 RepID=A0AAE0GXK5_9CHLO|nr:hypothetical protein CYMTET_6378 [Cymbomonas tetramitiformis]
MSTIFANERGKRETPPPPSAKPPGKELRVICPLAAAGAAQVPRVPSFGMEEMTPEAPIEVMQLHDACHRVLPDADPGWCANILSSAGFWDKTYQDCAVVGNAQRQLLMSEAGGEIDNMDAVLRVNQAPSGGNAHNFVGTKTTFRLINQQWTSSYRADVKQHLVLDSNLTLLVSRTDWETYFRSAYAIKTRRPDVTPRLLTRDAVDIAGQILRQIKICHRVHVYGVGMGGSVQGSRGDEGGDSQFGKETGTKGNNAEAGQVRGGATSFHYFEQHNYGTSREFGKEPHHSWDLEHDALQVLHGAGYIKHHLPPVYDWRDERRRLEGAMQQLKDSACNVELNLKAKGLPGAGTGWRELRKKCEKDQEKERLRIEAEEHAAAGEDSDENAAHEMATHEEEPLEDAETHNAVKHKERAKDRHREKKKTQSQDED